MNATADTPSHAGGALGDRRLRLAFGGLSVAMFIGALDQTIMATALPTIAGQLGGLTELSWVVTAYVLAASASTPLWGKASDLYGRRRLIGAAIAVLIGFSALSGTAQSMAWLIAFRALQGIGAGGMMTLATPASPIWSRRASAAATRGTSSSRFCWRAWPARCWEGCSWTRSRGGGRSTSTCPSAPSR